MEKSKVIENSTLKPRRKALFKISAQKQALFGTLSHVIITSKQKFDMERASNRDRQGWGRLIVTAIEAYARLLTTTQLDEIEKRLEVLENNDLR